MSSDQCLDLDTIIDDSETVVGKDGKLRRIIHTYHIHKCIGEGGMAAVYEASYFAPNIRYSRDGSGKAPTVAIKYLKPEFLDSQPSSGGKSPHARFTAEAQTMMSVVHPNIIRILRQGKDQYGRPFIAMEYIPGGQTLMSAIEKAKRQRAAQPTRQPIRGSLIPWRNLVPLLNQILDALEELHGKGIFHRDVKPDNLLICVDNVPNYCVKLTDFGIAKRLTQTVEGFQRLTQTGDHIGTPTHMAPEQIEPVEQIENGKTVCTWPVGPWTDIWSFGVMLYQLVTGELPFASENIAKLWTSILDLDIEYTPMSTHVEQLHPQLEEVVRRCLTKRPWERIQYVGEVRELLKTIDHPVESIPAPRSIPNANASKTSKRPLPRRSAKRFGRTAWQIMIGIISVLIFTILFMTLRRRPTDQQRKDLIATADARPQPSTMESAATSSVKTPTSTASSQPVADPGSKIQLKQSKTLQPNSQASSRFGLAKKLIRERRYAAAVAVLKLVIADAPDFPPAYRELALCHLRQGHSDEAKRLVAIYRTYTADPLPKELQQL